MNTETDVELHSFCKTIKNAGVGKGVRYWTDIWVAFEHCADDNTEWPETLGLDKHGDCLDVGDWTIVRITEEEYDAA